MGDKFLDALRIKVVLSLAILIIGGLAVPFFISNVNASQPQAPGFLIDFGDWNVTFTTMDMQKNTDPYDALEVACTSNNFTSTLDGSGTVEEINGISADEAHTWDLWTISNNSITWVKQDDPHNTDLSGYTIAAWAYTGSGGTPTVAVDDTGRSIYGYQTAQRIITLSPALTEITGSLRAVTSLVGTDLYSNYPSTVVAGQNNGTIQIVGDYLNPSFEQIVARVPDMVLCDGSLYSHYAMCEKLRNTGVNSVLMYGGDSVQTIMDNIYIAGVVLGYGMRAGIVINSIETAEQEITSTIAADPQASHDGVMLALSPDKSPWVSGSDTYMADLTSAVGGNNVFSHQSGWVQINSEQIMSANPSVIILYSTEYSATQDDYNSMINSLPAEWKATSAYKSGNIYLVCGTAGEMSQIPGPRFIQLMELTARILHPDVFTDIQIPKYIGYNYEDFLTFTKDLDFNN